jgi:ABC-type amino acid transport substrate-binding protein
LRGAYSVSLLTHYAPRNRAKPPFGTHHISRFTLYALRFTPPASRFTLHVSRFIITLILLLVLTGLFLWWLLAPRDDGALAEVQRRGALRVGLDASFPPFESIGPDGDIVGLDADIARAIAADLGVQAEFVNIGFDGLYDALLARRVDLVISSLPYDPRRTEDVAYTSNYFNAGQVLLTRPGEEAIQDAAGLAGRSVAVEWGSQAHMEGLRLARELAKKSPNPAGKIRLERQATAVEAVDALLAGRVDAAIVDAPTAISASPQGLWLVTYVSDEWYAGAVRLDSRRLLAEVNRSLARLEESGELAKMQARWFHGE